MVVKSKDKAPPIFFFYYFPEFLNIYEEVRYYRYSYYSCLKAVWIFFFVDMRHSPPQGIENQNILAKTKTKEKEKKPGSKQ